MRKAAPALLAALFIFAACTSPNTCELSESYSPAVSRWVLDSGFKRYQFRFDLNQKVEIYTGDCANDKSINRTTLKLTSLAPCEQTANFIIDVNMGGDSYQIKQDSVVIKPDESIDFGVVRQGGQRIDYAQIDIAIYCPLCPGDTQ